jgi:hypothetical protein
VGGQRHARAAFFPTQEKALVRPVQEAEWAPGKVWTGVVKIKALVSTGVRTPNHPTRSKWLDRLRYPGPQSG